jgi:hypothetical protein
LGKIFDAMLILDGKVVIFPKKVPMIFLLPFRLMK